MCFVPMGFTPSPPLQSLAFVFSIATTHPLRAAYITLGKKTCPPCQQERITPSCWHPHPTRLVALASHAHKRLILAVAAQTHAIRHAIRTPCLHPYCFP